MDIDVLKMMERWSHQHSSGNFTCHVDGREIDEVRKVVEEVIEAALDRNEAEGMYGAAANLYGEESNFKPMCRARERMRLATKRYVVALAAAQGGKSDG